MANCVMATIYPALAPVVQWNTKDLDGILHAGNRLHMKIPKTHEYLLISYMGNTLTKCGQRYNIATCRDVWYFY